MEWAIFRDLGLALGLGFLVGVQREQVDSRLAGVRTFSLISLFGALAALLAKQLESIWLLAAGLLVVVALFWLGVRSHSEVDDAEPGVTTEFAAVVMYTVGALMIYGYHPQGIAVAGVVALLLHWKTPLHRFVDRIDRDDLNAVVRLVLVGMVILPVLPNETYGPYNVLNPFEIWLMVVLIVGMSVGAYVIRRLLGAKVSTLVGGFLGGLISSTATSISFSRRTKEHPDESSNSAMVIMVASTIVFARVLVEVAIVAPKVLIDIAPPLAVVAGLTVLICVAQYFWSRGDFAESEAQEADANLKSAVVFGVLYGAVLFGVAAAEEHFGDSGMYIVAGISGLTDLDAITLSTSQLMGEGRVSTSVGWRLIMVGYLANLLFKGIAVGVLGSREVFIRVAIVFGLTTAGGVATMLFWPS